MTDDVSLGIGANSTKLDADLKQAANSVRGFGSTLKASISDARAPFEQLNANVSKLTTSIDQLNATSERTARAASTLRDIGVGATLLAAGYIAVKAAAFVAREAINGVTLGAQAGQSAATAAITPWANLAKTILNYRDSIGVIDTTPPGLLSAVQGWLRDAALVRAGTLEIASGAAAAAGNFWKLEEAAKSAGFKTSESYLRDLSIQLQVIKDLTAEDIGGILGTFGAIENLSSTAMSAMVKLVATVAHSADEAKSLSKSLVEAFNRSPQEGAALYQSIADKFRSISAETIKQVENGNKTTSNMSFLNRLFISNNSEVKKLAETYLKQANELDRQAEILAAMPRSADELKNKFEQIAQTLGTITARENTLKEQTKEIEEIARRGIVRPARSGEQPTKDQSNLYEIKAREAEAQKRLNDERAGGSATEQAELEIAQKRLDVMKDTTAAAAIRVAAAKKEYEEGLRFGATEIYSNLKLKALKEQEAALDNAQQEHARAANALEAQKAPTTEKEIAIKIAGT